MCSCCSQPVPGTGADMTVVIAGVSEALPAGTVYLHSETAGELVSGLEECTVEQHHRTPALPDSQVRARKERLGKLVSLNGGLPEGLSSLLDVFSACIGCRACREVCPLCHCVVCDYETDRTRWSPEKISRQARARGALRVPSGTIQFHLGRLMHISASCVSCGQCSDACPAGIPVAEIFARAAISVQSTLKYSPGKDPEGPPPMATYDVMELEEIPWSRRPH